MRLRTSCPQIFEGEGTGCFWGGVLCVLGHMITRPDRAEAGLPRQGRALHGAFEGMVVMSLAFYHCGKIPRPLTLREERQADGRRNAFPQVARKPRERKSGWQAQYPFTRYPHSDLASSHKATPPEAFTVSQKHCRMGAKPSAHGLSGAIQSPNHSSGAGSEGKGGR